MTPEPPAHLVDWRGQEWSPGCGRLAAHPNARFTAPLSQLPTIDPAYDDPAGVPISAFLFGGRSARNAPLVYQAFNFGHGVYGAATLSSEKAAAQEGNEETRRDPMAMLPFCGYNMGDYFAHWLEVGRHLPDPPRIFHVNWFRRGADGTYLWPGFGENVRVLDWVVRRVRGSAYAVESPIGWMPRYEDLNFTGLQLTEGDFRALMAVDREVFVKEAELHEELFDRFLDRLPKEFVFERELLRSRLWRSPKRWELSHGS